MSDETDTTRREYLLVAVTAAAVAVCSLAYYYSHHAVLLYGDAVAHINIARRVFDSQRPGPSQLGTVWLPLPHVLMLPFVISDWAWRTGLGGSIPSMFAYVAGVLGIFRLLRRGMSWAGATSGVARVTAWIGAIAYGANPNLVYMQATAMGESIYLAFFIWAVVFFAEFARASDDPKRSSRCLRWCAVMLLGCMLTRYDGWFATACFGLAALGVVIGRELKSGRRAFFPSAIQSGLLAFVLIVAIAPAFWLGWNKFYFGNSLEWMTGPYSARAIMQRSMNDGAPPHPGYHSVKTAAVYYVKCAKLNLSGDNLGWGGARYGWPRRIENTWPAVAILGSILLLIFARRLWPLLLLWIPLPFYALSIAYGGVPIFMPIWWPFSFYNVRYGLNMLPLAAATLALTVGLLCTQGGYLDITKVGHQQRRNISTLASRRWGTRQVLVVALTVLAIAFLAISYGTIWQKSGPVCLHEAAENSAQRIPLELRAGAFLRTLPPDSTLLMQIGYYVGVLERAGIPLKRTINETDFKLWEAALTDPASHAEFVVTAGNDRVAASVRQHSAEFEPIATFEAGNEPRIVVYKRK